MNLNVVVCLLILFYSYRIPGLTIATDIICGFPTETEQDFEETMSLCKKYKFPSLFINQFFPRPGTPAALLPRIATQDVKQRTKKLTDLFYSYQPYNDKVGEVQEVLVTEVSHDKEHYVGHNKFYEQVLLPMDKQYMGKLVTVKIYEATKFSMHGQPMENVVMPGLAMPLETGQVSGVRGEKLVKSKFSLAVAFVLISLFVRIVWMLL